MNSSLLSRKFITTIIVAVILMIVFFVMIKHGRMTDMSFGLWLAGLLANFGIYTTGNIMAKQK